MQHYACVRNNVRKAIFTDRGHREDHDVTDPFVNTGLHYIVYACFFLKYVFLTK